MSIKSRLQQAREEIETHLLEDILPFWKTNVVDHFSDGFHGYIFYDLSINHESEKGCILHSRILWAFSAAYMKWKAEDDLAVATRAFNYIKSFFQDREYGGFYWSLDREGKPLESKKHIYNQAFVIYGLTEYYRASGNEEALEMAKELFHLIEKLGYDRKNKGYLEAFNREWNTDEDLRLSAKDMNVKKTMNSHLHILEAYTNLYRVWKEPLLKARLEELFDVVMEKVLNQETGHYRLFFNETWEPQADIVSYGHDIEGSWLMTEAVEVLEDRERAEKLKPLAVKMVDGCVKDGLQEDGSLINESEHGVVIDADRIWWVQAESMVGFLNAYQLTNDERYLECFLYSWRYVKTFLIDPDHGEWYWKLSPENEVDKSMPIVEPWKGPYHNGRACLESIERLTKILTD
ncbi:mannobiose 2-epimerase [Evansella caseinilytica]|uniref:Cellobiose 2-epimerase n=1 Tax=Evansella caseinilytica TaxID=1503961 RepID=A0A1H3S7D9_9BACI|nr:AGE family epimerase/isomerase [Evansella caseinilytica]SDZ33872.1 mannobiose 2-epimerase [Evansella caseinilytica]